VVTDASATSVGAALHQTVDGRTALLGMFSKKLSDTQLKYSAFDRKLLGAYLAVLHFRSLIEGRRVTIFTDHKPLEQAFNNNTRGNSDRNQRYMSVIAEYANDVQYIRGSDNVVADALSRLPSDSQVSQVTATDLPADLPAIAEHQAEDNVSESEHCRFFPIDDNRRILCETSTGYPRPVVPATLQTPLIAHFHQLGHYGFRKTASLITTRFYWHDMRSMIKQYCRGCEQCQRSKVSRHTKAGSQAFNLPSRRLETVHIDIVGPLPVPERKHDVSCGLAPRYLLTMIDRHTGWLEAAPLETVTAQSVSAAFIATWIARFGVPLYVITDRGPQFESELFQILSSAVGFHRLRTTAYHPQANGKIERAHRSLKAILKAKGESWLDDLPLALLAMHVAPDEDGVSPFARLTGEHPMLPRVLTPPGDDDPHTLRMRVDDLVDRHQTTTANKQFIPAELWTTEKVWIRVDRVRRPLEAPYSGPYPVVRRDEKFFIVETRPGQHDAVSIGRLKPWRRPATPFQSPRPASVDAPPTSPEPSQERTGADVRLPDQVPTSTQATSAPEARTRSGRRVHFKRHNDFLYF
jgi:cleavage and polyadenylation specificity factor subunit 1